MDKEWKPKVGDLVWVRGAVTEVDDDDLPYRVSFDGDELWLRRAGIRPDTPEPAEIGDVAVLRRAAAIMRAAHWPTAELDLLTEVENIEAARRVPTLLEALKALVAADDKEMAHTPEMMAAARRAIAAAEKGEG